MVSHNNHNSKLVEGSEKGDLRNLVHPDLHIDEYKSKMGNDEDICVISFKVAGKEPCTDLVNFIEKGYDWVLDADISSGEIQDGDFLVFIEAERDKTLPENIFKMMDDIMNLTDQTLDEWSVKYPKTNVRKPLTLQSLKRMVPTSRESYIKMVGVDDREEDDNTVSLDGETELQLENLKIAAGMNINKTIAKDEQIESLQVAAGIK